MDGHAGLIEEPGCGGHIVTRHSKLSKCAVKLAFGSHSARCEFGSRDVIVDSAITLFSPKLRSIFENRSTQFVLSQNIPPAVHYIATLLAAGHQCLYKHTLYLIQRNIYVYTLTKHGHHNKPKCTKWIFRTSNRGPENVVQHVIYVVKSRNDSVCVCVCICFALWLPE